MHGEAYAQSARVASAMGPFAGYAKNAEPMLRVIDKHRQHAHMIDSTLVPKELLQAALDVWDEAYALGAQHGYRNSQVTVLAPTGTIGFMMDCDTTGIEPDIALVKYKKLVGGGVMKIVNQSVPGVLRKLGYTPIQVEDILRYIDEKEMIEGAPHLKEEHLAIFDCAFPPRERQALHPLHGPHQDDGGGAALPLGGHLQDRQHADRRDARGHPGGVRRGLAARPQGDRGLPRRLQALPAALDLEGGGEGHAEAPAAVAAVPAPEGRPARRKLPDERHAITHKFSIAGHEGYITVGMYEDGKPGEIFLVMAKEGSTISGLMDAFATSISMALQYGVPLEALVEKFSHVRFEPSGFTKNPEIPYAKSITDYIFRWLASKFLSVEHQEAVGVQTSETSLKPHSGPVTPVANPSADRAPGAPSPGAAMRAQSDAPPCHYCGSIMIRNGSCYRCANCGSTSGLQLGHAAARPRRVAERVPPQGPFARGAHRDQAEDEDVRRQRPDDVDGRGEDQLRRPRLEGQVAQALLLPVVHARDEVDARGATGRELETRDQDVVLRGHRAVHPSARSHTVLADRSALLPQAIDGGRGQDGRHPPVLDQRPHAVREGARRPHPRRAIATGQEVLLETAPLRGRELARPPVEEDVVGDRPRAGAGHASPPRTQSRRRANARWRTVRTLSGLSPSRTAITAEGRSS